MSVPDRGHRPLPPATLEPTPRFWAHVTAVLSGAILTAALAGLLRADPLGEAIDLPDLAPSAAGSQGWVAQTAVNHDGFEAARSAAIGDGGQAVMELSVAGPGTVSFWWKVSSEAAADTLSFLVDGVVQGSAISGETAWQPFSATLGAGSHLLRWVYAKNGAASSGSDCGWVDEVVIPVQGVPVIAAQPMAATVVAGGNAMLTLSAGGGALQYQWYRGTSGDTSAPVPGASGPMLLTPALRANATFWARVSNSAGSADSQTSAVTLTAPPPARLMVCGYNYYGQLGDGTVTNRSTPELIATEVTGVTAGTAHNLFVKADGSLWGMGLSQSGQLGFVSSAFVASPIHVADEVATAAAGYAASQFVKTDGTLWKLTSTSPQQIATGVTATAVGGGHSVFLKTDGTLWATGYNLYGQLGDGTTTDRTTPVQVAAGVLVMSAGYHHSAFVKTDGTLWTMGENTYGQLGDGTTTNRATPVKVATGVVAAAAAVSHSLFAKADGTLWAMGYNGSGMLGDGTTNNRPSPVLVAGGVTKMAGGGSHSMFVKADVSLWAMGSNYYGALGDGSTTTDRLLPVRVGSAATAVSLGASHSLILDFLPAIASQPVDTGTLPNGTPSLSVTPSGVGPWTYQWYRGMSGDTSQPVAAATSATFAVPPGVANASYWVRLTNPFGSVDSRTALVEIVSPPAVTALVGPSATHRDGSAILIVKATGGMLAYQWYDGVAGDTSSPLLDATTAQIATPPLRASHSFWVRVTNSEGTADSETLTVGIGLSLPARLIACGYNSSGQLGDGTTVSSAIPIQVDGDVAFAAAGGSHSLYLKTDGNLWAMGANGSGQLGDGTTTSRSAPVMVATGVLTMAAGASHSLYVKTDHTLWATGSNSSGQLGDGTTTSRSVPAQVASDVVAAAAGVYHTLFLKADGTLWAAGSNASGQLGDGTTTNRTTPVQIASGVSAMAAGSSHTLLLKTDGTLWAAGSNSSGQLGDSTATNRATPVQIATEVMAVAAGSGHSLFLKRDGTLWGMGSSSAGELGIRNLNATVTPRQVASGVANVAASGSESMFLNNDGSLWAMGWNAYGQLGDGSTTNAISPVPLSTAASSFACGSHSLVCDLLPAILTQPGDTAIPAGGTPTLTVGATAAPPLAYQWYRGATGDTSQPVPDATSESFTTPPLTASASYWVRVANPFGANDSRAALVQVVAPPAITAQSTPQNSAWLANPWLTVTAASELLSYQWYEGASGDTTQPVIGATGPQLLGLPQRASTAFWVRVSNAAGHADSATIPVTVGTPIPARLLGWGQNTWGQLGDGTTVNRSSPVVIANGVVNAAAGSAHSLFVRTDGTLWGMGGNYAGQIGDGGSTTNYRTTPAQVTTGVLGVAAGSDHSLLLKTDGTLWAMGSNTYGQLGDGTTTSRLTPVQIATGVISMAAGHEHSLFLKTDGTLWAMGHNGVGELGDGTNTHRSVPIQVASGVAAVAARFLTSFFIKVDGTLWGMGINNNGQLGDGTNAIRTSPVQVATGVQAVSAGNWHSLFLKANGTLWTMGSNSGGQLGDGTTTDRLIPVQVASGVLSAAAGGGWTMLLKPGGVLWATGGNSGGQLGDGTTTNRLTPVQVATGISSLALGSSHSLALDVRPFIVTQPADTPTFAGGTPTLSVTVTGAPALAYQWYRGSSGDTSQPLADAVSAAFTTPPNAVSANYWVRIANGYGTADSRTVFVQVVAPPAITAQPGPQTVAPNGNALLSVTVDGALLSFQWYEGPGGDTSKPVPEATGPLLVTPPLRTNTSYWLRAGNAAGNADTGSITVTVGAPAPGRLFTFGSNIFGQLGNAAVTRSTVPMYAASGVVAAAGGSLYSLWLKADGTLWGAGNNESGQLGISPVTINLAPTQVAADVLAAAAGASHSLILKTDGTLWSTGANGSGQLGDGTTTNRTTAVPVASGVISISTGSSHSLIIKSDGSLWACGANTYGQLGDGTTTSRSSPVAVAANVLAVAAGGNHSLFLKTDGSLWAAGYNLSGQLGDGTTTDRSVPVPVATGVAAMAAGKSHSLFLKVDGTLWAVGDNTSGGLGDGTTTTRTTPVQIASGVRAMAAGQNCSLFIKADGSGWAAGYNNSGQLGDGTTTSRSIPVQIASAATTCALGTNHSLVCSLAPAILAPPADAGIVASGTATLTVLADGTEPLVYQWYRGNSGDTSQPVADADSATFTTPVLTSDATYWVRVASGFGTIDSRAALVKIVTPPAIEAIAGPATVNREASAALTVTATGGMLSYQWFEGASGDTANPVPGATGAQLTTRRLRSNATFWVRASNAAGSVESQAFTVAAVIRPPARLMACGDNSYGQLGDGTKATRATPVRITSDVAAVATGQSHSLLVTSDGTLWSMGYNFNGQLGLGNSSDRSTPTQVTSGVLAVAAGGSHSLFIKTDGTLWAMGYNSAGQLGDGSNSTRQSPVQVATGVSSVAAGANHSLFIKADGTLWAMGDNSAAQLGDGSRTNRKTPVQVASGVAAVAAGTSHSLFVKTDGTLWAMGDNTYAQLGTGMAGGLMPVQVAAGVLTMDAGTFHSLFVKADGTLWGMGYNNSGQLGDGTRLSRSTPVQIATGVLHVAAGSSHSMFVKTDNSLWATGSNNSGQLGNGNYNMTITPVQVATAVTSLAVGDTHGLYCDMIPLIGTQPADAGAPAGGTATLTVTPLGESPFTYQWYRGTAGDTSQPVAGATAATFTTPNLTSAATYWVRVTNAHGSVDSRSVSVQIVTPPQITAISGLQTVAAGRSVALSAAADGGVLSYQWYEGTAGETTKPVPGATGAQLLSQPLWTSTAYWVRVANAAGNADSGTLPVTVTPRPATRLMACGYNSAGQLGDGTTIDRSNPVRAAADAVEMDAGDAHSMFLKADGSLWACGSNVSGRLGDGTTTARPVPVQVAAAVLACSAGGSHSLYVASDGALWATGYNFYGQLGNGTTVTRSSPAQVAADVLSVAAGQSHSLFVKADSSLWAMGYNNSGQLGDGTFINRPTPVPVATAVAVVAAGSSHSLFIRTDGSLWAMGNNGSGRLGDGTTTTRPTPVKVATAVAAVAAGANHSLFLKTDGTLWAMGSNTYGQLGDGTTTSRSTPVQVASGVIDLAAGQYHSMFLKSDATLWAMGSNAFGQLGDGTTTNRTLPAQIASAVVSLALGASHSLYRDLLPLVATEPLDAAARLGGTATLSVVPGGAGPFTCQWYGGQRGDLSQPVPEATAVSFTTPPLTSNATYWVRVSNAHGTADSRPATVTVIAMSPEYQAWATACGLTVGTIAPAADPDGDDLANLVEYALATDPLLHTANGRPVGGMVRDDGRDWFVLTHRRLKGSGLVFTYQSSNDVSAWTDIVPEIAVLNADIDGDGRTELVRASRPLGVGETSGFLRLRIAMP